ncbi:uncharacterized protein LOC129587251 [Paramacrobiotus metropolitanus]|uniref:uncharacterized protein LOC129587251 n=1 Tax=Paramacrobiotus metropolitanus TaxID=2943436 RepID=UPI00244577DB|nr:uncharacterized protein LOC129587251 [Paramacrobiotus metropolitanus]
MWFMLLLFRCCSAVARNGFKNIKASDHTEYLRTLSLACTLPTQRCTVHSFPLTILPRAQKVGAASQQRGQGHAGIRTRNWLATFQAGDLPPPGLFAAHRACTLPTVGGNAVLQRLNNGWHRVKDFSKWPTIPQVFIGGEFVGGSVNLLQMHRSGELMDTLKKAGIHSTIPDPNPPTEAKARNRRRRYIYDT